MRHAALFLLLLAAPAAADEPKPGPLRFDGLYRAQSVLPGLDQQAWAYLRFYADGAVIDVTSTGKAHALARWFGRSKADVSRGKYVVSGDKLTFSTTSDSGTVDFEGTIAAPSKGKPGGLTVHWKSRINGAQGTYHYAFVPVKLQVE